MRAEVDARVDTARRAAVISTSFDAPPPVVWTLFSDPGKLVRWWGPPGVPMTVDHHDLRPGGRVDLTVATAEGPVRGRWVIHDVEPPQRLTFTFSSDGLDGAEIAVGIEAGADGTTTMTVTARFPSDSALRHAVDIGFVEGVRRSCAASHEVITAG